MDVEGSTALGNVNVDCLLTAQQAIFNTSFKEFCMQSFNSFRDTIFYDHLVLV